MGFTQPLLNLQSYPKTGRFTAGLQFMFVKNVSKRRSFMGQ